MSVRHCRLCIDWKEKKNLFEHFETCRWAIAYFRLCYLLPIDLYESDFSAQYDEHSKQRELYNATYITSCTRLFPFNVHTFFHIWKFHIKKYPFLERLLLWGRGRGRFVLRYRNVCTTSIDPKRARGRKDRESRIVVGSLRGASYRFICGGQHVGNRIGPTTVQKGRTRRILIMSRHRSSNGAETLRDNCGVLYHPVIVVRFAFVVLTDETRRTSYSTGS